MNSDFSLAKAKKRGHNQTDYRPIMSIAMSRLRSREPWVQQKVTLPATLMARFSRFHWDPVLNKPQYGAISRVMTELLTEYVNRLENPSTFYKEKQQ